MPSLRSVVRWYGKTQFATWISFWHHSFWNTLTYQVSLIWWLERNLTLEKMTLVYERRSNLKHLTYINEHQQATKRMQVQTWETRMARRPQIQCQHNRSRWSQLWLIQRHVSLLNKPGETLALSLRIPEEIGLLRSILGRQMPPY